MCSYLNIDRGFIQRGLTTQNHQEISIIPLWFLFKFKLAVFTVPPNALAYAMTCDPCQPTKSKGLHKGVHICGYWVPNPSFSFIKTI